MQWDRYLKEKKKIFSHSEFKTMKYRRFWVCLMLIYLLMTLGRKYINLCACVCACVCVCASVCICVNYVHNKADIGGLQRSVCID